MTTVYVTGSIAGLYPNQLADKFNPIVQQMMAIGFDQIKCTSFIESKPGLSFKEKIDLKMAAVAEADFVVFTDDWKDCMDSRLEFIEASRLRKHIRKTTQGDYADMTRIVSSGDIEIFM